MEEPPRAHSAMQLRQSQFQGRASQFLKKVSNIRGRIHRRKTGNEDGAMPYKRQARSVDTSQKPYMSQPVLGLEMPNPSNSIDTDSSSQSASSNNDSPRRSQQTSGGESFGNPTTNGVGLTRDTTGSPLHRPQSPSTLATLSQDTAPASETGPVHQVTTPFGTPDIVVSRPLVATEREFRARNFAESSTPQPDANATPKPSRSSVFTSDLVDKPLPAIGPSIMAATASSSSHSLSSSLSSSSRRTQKPRLNMLPQSPFKRLNAEGGVRLSPSIITRQPMPFLNLPTLPLPTPSEPARPAHASSRLRSMPALPLEGPNDRDDDPDHENAGLGDSDEDDEGEYEAEAQDRELGGSDDEDGDDANSHHSPSGPGLGLPAVDVSRLDLSFLDHPHDNASSHTAHTPHIDSTPIATHSFDYFTSKLPERNLNSPRTPRLDDTMRRIVGTRQTQEISHPTPLTPGSSRPGLYHLASKSMVNMLTFNDASSPVPPSETPSQMAGKAKVREDLPVAHPKPSASQLSSPVLSIAPRYSTVVTDDKLIPSLRRRRSMPMFNASSEPPPYPSFAPHPMRRDIVIQPRDDEGRERLPAYSNSIYITAIMPRKMEFSSPGVQARDRKWRRVLCVLEGTAFRVYKCPPSVAGVSAIGGWWERKVGVGDASCTAPPGPSGGPKADARKREMVRSAKLDADALSASEADVPPQSDSPASSVRRTKRHLAATLLHPTSRTRSHSRSRSDATNDQSPQRSLALHRPSSGLGHGSVAPSGSQTSVTVSMPSSSTLSSSPPSSASRSHFMPRSQPASADVPEPDATDLLRSYTLQRAESGLGNDYLKRKNVIRVRMEGEQFLLQAQDVPAVVEWIEGFHAATNIALDLDERVMPKGPMFPRRRRRRARRPDGDGIQRPSSSSRPTGA